jgi:hypothetical protein
MADRPHTLQLDLLDEDGQPAMLPLGTVDNPVPENRPLQISGHFEVVVHLT